jgi:hypothetical protein
MEQLVDFVVKKYPARNLGVVVTQNLTRAYRALWLATVVWMDTAYKVLFE